MQDILLFGIGLTSEVISYYIDKWGDYRIVAYVVDKPFLKKKEFFGKTVISTESLSKYPPSQYKAFVAVGYQNYNFFREQKVDEFRKMGYELVSIVNPNAPLSPHLVYGNNCLILPDDAQIMPYAVLKDNVFVYVGCTIGHHTTIYDNCWIAAGATIAGNVKIQKNCFVGVGAAIGNGVNIGEKSVIGCGTTVTKNVKPVSVALHQNTKVVHDPEGLYITFLK